MTMIRCAIYVRISLDREGAGLGVERQEKECRELCARKGWHVVEVYVDNDVSATSGKPRPEWVRLIDDIKSGRVNAIAVWHVDRMTRKPRELEDVIDLAEKLGVQLGTVTGEIDLSTPTGKLVARMLGAAARHEAEHKGERQRAQRAQYAANGNPNKGGARPFGYADDRISSVPREAEAIRDAARRVLAGETLRSIAEDWNSRDEPITTSRGKLWTGSMIRQMLMSARISGRREIGGSHGKLGEIVNDSAWDAIITPKQSDRLRTMLTNSSRQSHTRSMTRRHLLSGLLSCGKCGAKLVALDAKSMRAGAMYRCPSPGARSDVKSCGALSVLMKYADPTVRTDALLAIESPELQERLHKRAELDPAVVKQIERDEQELVDIARDKSDGILTRAEWLAQRETVQQRLDVNKRIVARATQTEALTLLDGDGEIEDRWAELNLSQQRAVIAEVFSEIVVMPVVTRGAKFTPDRIKSTFRF